MGRCARLSVVSLLSNQSARPEGTVNGPFVYVCLKASSGTGEMGWFNYRIWGCGDCYILHGFRCQCVAREGKIPVLRFTRGCCQLRGSCQYASPQSESLRLRRSAGWLVHRASAVCPMLGTEVPKTTVSCVLSVCVRTEIQP